MSEPRCTNCFASSRAGARFCEYCGHALAAAPRAAPAAPAFTPPAAPPAQELSPWEAPPRAPVSGGGFSDFFSKVSSVVNTVSNVMDVVNTGLGVASLFTEEFTRIRHPRGHEVVVGACRKDREDPRDVQYDRHNDVDPNGLPAFVDLREHMTPVEDQGELGSCTANAIAGAYEYLLKRTTGRYSDVSRLFIYYLERDQEGTVEQDAGAALRDGIKVLKEYGVCTEKVWPYNVKSFRHRPPEHAFAEASDHTIDEYHRIPVDLHAMKVCLAEGYPFVFGMKIFKSFESHGHHGRIQLPRSGEKGLGGHAMVACGYSEKDQVFLVRNSWGSDWGDGGYCYVPYAYLANEDYTHDCWTVRRAHNLDFTQSGDSSGVLSFFTGASAAGSLASSLFQADDTPGDDTPGDEDTGDEDTLDDTTGDEDTLNDDTLDEDTIEEDATDAEVSDEPADEASDADAAEGDSTEDAEDDDPAGETDAPSEEDDVSSRGRRR